MKKYDIVVIGSGFGGSLFSMIAKRLGKSVLLVERGKHPRFAIGESTSPLANLIIEQLADKYHLPRLKPLTTYGPWQRTYSDIACGLKRGFSYFSHEFGKPFHDTDDHHRQLLVAANPNSETADTHWYRQDVDHFFQQEAIVLGVDYSDETAANLLGTDDEGVSRIRFSKGPVIWDVECNLIVDASGPRGFLSRELGIPEVELKDYPQTATLFSHFEGVERVENLPDFANCMNGEVPFPVDDAALHHVFDGGWIWVLRFNNGITSAGVACETRIAERFGMADVEAGWHRFLKSLPSVAKQFANAKHTRPFIFSPKMTYRAERVVGKGWAMLPSAAGFVDPLFSTGIPLTLLGIERLGEILGGGSRHQELGDGLAEYGRITLEEIDWTAKFIGNCCAGFKDFHAFQEYSMHYFAAASYSEMARRLPGANRVRRYLASDRPDFAKSVARNGDFIRSRNTNNIADSIRAGIKTINIAGLSDPAKRQWYGVDLQDVVNGAGKLGLEPAIVRELIKNSDWADGCRV
ncbi:MAG: tryptophan 7-halogenase [Chthonomonadales bacterium]